MVRLLTLAVFLSVSLRAETVLVLPFVNHSSAANLDWIGESIAVSLRESLVAQGLLVLDRTDRLEGYRRASLRPGTDLTHASIIKLGQYLDASIVIYGDYQREAPADAKDASQATLRINGRMVDLRRIHQSPAFSQFGPLEEFPAMLRQLAWDAFKQVAPGTTVQADEFIHRRPPVRLDAMESYSRGLLAANGDQRHRFFTQAARLDDKFSAPCLELGQEAWNQKDYKTAANWFQRVDRGDSH